MEPRWACIHTKPRAEQWTSDNLYRVGYEVYLPMTTSTRHRRSPWTATLRPTARVRELKADGLLPTDTKQRSSKYLNNLIEQDHRSVKHRIAVMLGFKQFPHAAITIAGIELVHRIRKGQFGLRRLGVRGRAAPAVWNAVLGA